jgi:soluble lytic murein transglycosylase-like protein
MSRSGPNPLRFVAALVALAAIGAAAFWWAWPAARRAGIAEVVDSIAGPVVVPAEYRSIIKAAAKLCPEIPPRVFAAQIAAESGWDPRARSGAGAQGIAQFMPKVWEQYGIDANDDGVASVWDPTDAIHSASLLNCVNRGLVKEVAGKRLENTLAAYNAGFNAVRKYDGVPPFPETEAYVKRILSISKTIEF